MEYKFRFDKVVRNKIPDHMTHEGSKPEVTVLDGAALREALAKKIVEEAQELARRVIEPNIGDDTTEEISDLQTALDAYIAASGIEDERLERARAAKSEKYGDFAKGFYVTAVTVAEDSVWLSHLLASPEKYPRIS